MLYHRNENTAICLAWVCICLTVLSGCGNAGNVSETDVGSGDTTVQTVEVTVDSDDTASSAVTDVFIETETDTETDAVAVDTEPVSDFPTIVVDFDALHEENPDIYAWITIPDTTIDFPILQRTDDNSYYLRRNALGKSDIYGCIFTENYNALDFEDPVTLIYGHTAKSGRMFGTLETNYSSASYLAEHNKIYIDLPDGEYSYTIFAAVPYSNQHILYYHDFTDDDVFTSFFRQIMSIRHLNAVFDRSAAPQVGDKVIILSTCLLSDNTQRFLVMAKRDIG